MSPSRSSMSAWQLGPLAGGHRGEHRRGRRHALSELLQQLVEVLRLAREKVAERSMNCSKPGSSGSPAARCSIILLRASRASRMCSRSSAPVADTALRHLVEVGLHDLLAQPLQQLLEALAGLGSR